MIKLKEACEIAKRYLETRDLFIRNTCRDFGDSWIFDWGWKNAPDEIDTCGSLVRVSKDNGRVTIFVLGVPHEENFKRFMKAPDIDISEYIYSQRCLKMKLENREKDLYCPILSKKIAIETCDDVANVAEDFHPERFAPEEFRKVVDYKSICQKCDNNTYN